LHILINLLLQTKTNLVFILHSVCRKDCFISQKKLSDFGTRKTFVFIKYILSLFILLSHRRKEKKYASHFPASRAKLKKKFYILKLFLKSIVILIKTIFNN
jgi:hypothetical protein